MRQNTLSIHSENILPIIKKWLYSSHDIFLRELVANACDANKKLRVLRDCGQAAADDEPFEIQIQVDPEKKTVTISDNGIGMTEEEVEKYIAQIAFSGAEEFLAKYKTQTEKDPMIGHFGLGFYSSYMVSAKVELQTLSYKPDAKPVFWSCDGSTMYEIGEGTRTKRGTDVILHLDEASIDYLEDKKLRDLLDRYCLFMPDPIALNGQSIGNEAPLWIKPPADCTDEDYLSFYRKLYPEDHNPIFWIHLNVDYPFRLQGILYFPKAQRQFDNMGSSIRLFCNRVFVSDHCRDFLPDFLTLMRGAIDSPDIPLNVSRSYLQIDHNVKQLGAHISKKVSDRLNALFKTDREKYVTCWPELESLVKLGLLQDEKFYEKIKDVVIWKNSSSQWTTLPEYLDRAKEKKVHYSDQEKAAPIQKVFLDQGIELIYTSSPIDVAVISSIEHKMSDVPFQRVDSTLDPSLIDESREKSLLDADGKSLASRIADYFRTNLMDANLEIEAKSLASDSLPGLVLLDENMRRLRDYLVLTQGKAPNQQFKKTFVVNTNNKLVQAAYRLADKHPQLSHDLTRQIYDLSRMAQKEMEPSEMEKVVAHNQQLLEQLTALVQ
ncbi:MAG: htpG [Parachlamydiales bacterium]|nr:htpG [Parachlamydiales bacterium]